MESEHRKCSNLNCRQEDPYEYRWRKSKDGCKCNACYIYFLKHNQDRIPKNSDSFYVCTHCYKTTPGKVCKNKKTNPVCGSCYFRKRREVKKDPKDSVQKTQLAPKRKGDDLNDETVSRHNSREKRIGVDDCVKNIRRRSLMTAEPFFGFSHFFIKIEKSMRKLKKNRNRRNI